MVIYMWRHLYLHNVASKICVLCWITCRGQGCVCNYTGLVLANLAAQEEECKMCVSVHIFQKAFGPITFRQMIGVQPNFYDGLPSSRPSPMQNDSSQIPIGSSKNVPTCAWVRPSSPYYRVRIGNNPKVTPRGQWIKFITNKSLVFSNLIYLFIFIKTIFLGFSKDFQYFLIAVNSPFYCIKKLHSWIAAYYFMTFLNLNERL